MIVGIPQETFPGETRVALIPASIPALAKAGIEVRVQSGAGQAAGFPDSLYVDKGAKIATSRDEVFAADVILQVRAARRQSPGGQGRPAQTRSPARSSSDCAIPWGSRRRTRSSPPRGATLFGLELLPRITRAQGMDVLSSQATIAGYRAVLLAAQELPKIFPMLITAAGTLERGEGLHRRRRRGRSAGDCHRPAARCGRFGL